jgi:hypothetical protein
MRALYSILLAFLFTTITFAQKSDNDMIARVRKVNGVEAYILCEPLRDYTVLVDAGTGIKAESAFTGGLINKSISDRVEQFIKRATKENGKIDAVVYSAGKRIIGIAFKDNGTAKTKGLARVGKVGGYPVFVMNEPVSDYTVVNSKGGGIKWKSLLTAGIVNNSIEDDVEAMVKKMQSRAADAVLFDGGKSASGIMFNNKK